MSLCLLKTRELSWQDHSINIEVILAPKKTDLLSKQHRSLGSKCEDEVTRYELNQNSFLKHLQLEKRHIGLKSTEFYVLKARHFLEHFPVDLRKEMLNRRSFSVALNKIRDEILDNQKSAKSEPLLRNRSVLYSPNTETETAMFPQLGNKSQKVSSSGKSDFYLTEVNENDDKRIEELPPVVIETNKFSPGKPSLRRSKTEYISSSRQNAESEMARPKLTRQKSVRFENDETADKKVTLQEKVREFIKEQEYFNSQVEHLHMQHVRMKEEDKNDKEKLMSAFESFCKTQNHSKTHIHHLVKLASKFKVSKSITNSAEHFKSSRSYRAIHEHDKNKLPSFEKPVLV